MGSRKVLVIFHAAQLKSTCPTARIPSSLQGKTVQRAQPQLPHPWYGRAGHTHGFLQTHPFSDRGSLAAWDAYKGSLRDSPLRPFRFRQQAEAPGDRSTAMHIVLTGVASLQ